MKQYQTDFLDLTLRLGVLKLGGEYKLKSGRISPYFFNAGLFNTGSALKALGEAFAAAIVESGVEVDMLFGPAYKGIPLVAAVAIALSEKYGRDLPFAFNRKEVKDHGEGGVIVGAPIKGKVLLIDDVITAGTAIRESVKLLGGFSEAQLVGVAVAMDRQEKAPDSDLSAIQSVENEYGIRVISVVNLDSVLNMARHKCEPATLAALEKYRADYGV